MPKKPSTCLLVEPYPPFTTRGWVILAVLAAHLLPRKMIRFELGVVGDVRQSGRVVNHELPAVLTPNGPLATFISDAFGIHFADRQSFDLATLTGRQFQARFNKGVDGCLQAIVAVRPLEKRIVVEANPVTKPNPQPEVTHGLG